MSSRLTWVPSKTLSQTETNRKIAVYCRAQRAEQVWGNHLISGYLVSSSIPGIITVLTARKHRIVFHVIKYF